MKLRQTYNLFLDDVRSPGHCLLYHTAFMPQNRAMYTLEDWTIVRDYEEFVKIVTEKMEAGEFPAKVSFDHDLADIHYDPTTWTENFKYKEKTGYDAAQWLVSLCIDNGFSLPECYVHSQNGVGSKRICEAIADYARYQEKFSPKND
jgi:hypothetical protein